MKEELSSKRKMAKSKESNPKINGRRKRTVTEK